MDNGTLAVEFIKKYPQFIPYSFKSNNKGLYLINYMNHDGSIPMDNFAVYDEMKKKFVNYNFLELMDLHFE